MESGKWMVDCTSVVEAIDSRRLRSGQGTKGAGNGEHDPRP